MALSVEPPLRTGRMKLPLGSLFWHEGGKPQAQTLVFLHGSWHDSGQWLGAMQHLSPSYHCLAPDLLGVGESVRQGSTPYSVALQVEALHGLLSALRVSRCTLVGHSLGAWVAGQYALTYPDQVQGLAVIAPEGATDQELRGRWRRDRWLVARWSPLPLVLPWLGKGGAALGDRRRCLRQHPAACQMLFRRRRAALQGELLQERPGQLMAPALVVQPTPGDDVTQRLGDGWLRRLPDARAIELPAAGLLGVEDAAFAAAVGDFLTSQPPRLAAPARPVKQLI
jgi:pimeloyl-ACP methyl ester carboxylesterase